MRIARQRDPARRAGHPDHRLEPRSAAGSGRADVSGAAAGRARAHGERRDAVALGSGAIVHGARATAETRLHADRTRSARRRRALRAGRGHSARAGARGRADALAVDAGNQQAAAQPVHAADRRRPRAARAPADAAGARRVVVRPPVGQREAAVRASGRLRRRLRSCRPPRRSAAWIRSMPEDVLDLVHVARRQVARHGPRNATANRGTGCWKRSATSGSRRWRKRGEQAAPTRSAIATIICVVAKAARRWDCRGRSKPEWTRRLETELDNLRAAIALSLGRRNGSHSRGEVRSRAAGFPFPARLFHARAASTSMPRSPSPA